MNYLNALQNYVSPNLSIIVPVTVAKLTVALRMTRMGYSRERISEFMAGHPSLELDSERTQSDPMLSSCPSLSLPFKDSPHRSSISSAT